MAAETSEPRSGLILQIGLFSILSIVGIRYGLVSYFDQQMSDEYMKKIAGIEHTQLTALRAEEQKMLTGGSMPIDKAMTMLAQQGRDRVLAPKASDDMAPMLGWTQSPNPHAPAAPATPAPAAGDGGATATAAAGDAGAAATAAKDAGAGAPSTTGTRDAGK